PCRRSLHVRYVAFSTHPIPSEFPVKQPPLPVAAVGRAGQPADEKPSRGSAPSRDGPAPILPIAERRPFRSSDPLAVSNEPRTLPACDDLGGEPFQVVRWHRVLLYRIP